MKADLRGFDYPLEFRRRQLHWQLLALQARKAKEQQGLDDLDQRLLVLQARLRPAQDSTMAPLDPKRQLLRLRFMADGHRRSVELQQDIARTRQRITVFAEQLGQCQNELDALDRDRAGQVAEHLQDQQRRESHEADQRWLANASQRQGEAE